MDITKQEAITEMLVQVEESSANDFTVLSSHIEIYINNILTSTVFSVPEFFEFAGPKGAKILGIFNFAIPFLKAINPSYVPPVIPFTFSVNTITGVVTVKPNA